MLLGLWEREFEAEAKDEEDEEDNAVEVCIVGIVAVKENSGCGECVL